MAVPRKVHTISSDPGESEAMPQMRDPALVAEAKGNDTKAAQAREALQARRAWLDQVRGVQS